LFKKFPELNFIALALPMNMLNEEEGLLQWWKDY
jgi:hypothetical protein